MTDIMFMADGTKPLTEADDELTSKLKIPGMGKPDQPKQEDRKQYTIEDIEKMRTGTRRTATEKKGQYTVEQFEAMRAGVDKRQSGEGFIKQLQNEFVATGASIVNLVNTAAVMPVQGLYGLGRLALGHDPDEVAESMAKLGDAATYQAQEMGEAGEALDRKMHKVDQVFGVFRPLAEKWRNHVNTPRPIKNDAGETVGWTKPLPAWYQAFGSAVIEIGPFILAGEGAVGAKGRYSKGRMSRSDFARFEEYQKSGDLGTRHTKNQLAERGTTPETPLPVKETVREPTFVDASGKERPLYNRPEIKIPDVGYEAPTTKGPVFDRFKRNQLVETDPGKRGRLAEQKKGIERGTKLYTGGAYSKMGKGLKDIWDKTTKQEIENNASLDNPASREAINRLVAQEDMMFVRGDIRNPKQLDPMIPTVDRVDISAGKNQVILAKKHGDPRLIVIDSGANLNRAQVQRYV
ncbi:MAG: hypothetical protein ACXABY_17655, partial [Candidatus Thorarchaeota archaeon]